MKASRACCCVKVLRLVTSVVHAWRVGFKVGLMDFKAMRDKATLQRQETVGGVYYG